MLIDIFARRYENVSFRTALAPRDVRLLVQGFRILAEDIYPYYVDGKEDKHAVAAWTELHDHLSRELGLLELGPKWFSTTKKWNGNDVAQSHKHTMLNVCKQWMFGTPPGLADDYLKDRISLLELGFRKREAELVAMNSQSIGIPNAERVVIGVTHGRVLPMPLTFEDQVLQNRSMRTEEFRRSVEELNARFRQADLPLHYHNGYIQESVDRLVEIQVEEPFWALVASKQWSNVDLDMKEAWTYAIPTEGIQHFTPPERSKAQ